MVVYEVIEASILKLCPHLISLQLLDEMLDNGFPLATESNILKELIKPPNILRTIANTVTGKTKYQNSLNFQIAFLRSFFQCKRNFTNWSTL